MKRQSKAEEALNSRVKIIEAELEELERQLLVTKTKIDALKGMKFALEEDIFRRKRQREQSSQVKTKPTTQVDAKQKETRK